VEHIVIGTIADPLAITEDLFNESVIEVALQKITALFSVRMGRKERGNFHSMIFQPFAGPKKLVFLQILVEIINIPVEISITTA
jgi:hypothetical protein